MESEVSPRRFRVADALVLIAAMGVASALLRYYWRTPMSLTPYMSAGTLQYDPTYAPLNRIGVVTTAALLLTALAPALLVLGLWRVDGPRWGLLRRPGFVACLVSTLAAGQHLVRQGLDSWQSGQHRCDVPAQMGSQQIRACFDFFPFVVLPKLPWVVGPWMIAALVVMAVVGRWRGRADWVETSGKILGASWIVLYLTRWL